MNKNLSRVEEYELYKHAGCTVAIQGGTDGPMPLLQWDTLASRMNRKPEELAERACELGLHLWHTRHCPRCGWDALETKQERMNHA